MGTVPTDPVIPADLSAVLAHAQLFAHLPERQRDELAAACGTHRYRSGERIFTRGDMGSAMYIVGSGAVALSDSSADGEEIVFDVLRPFRTFGELSLIDNGARIVSATARHKTTLISAPGPAVRRLLSTNPAFAFAMLKTLADLVRGLDDHLADRTLLDLRARVIKYLISAAGGGRQDATAAPPGELRVDLCVSQTDLARLVGGSRQHVNRIILDLEREGAIRRHGPRVVAIRPALLQPVTSGPAYRGR